MEKIELVLPTNEYREQVLDYKREFEINSDALNGSGGLGRAEDFDSWVSGLSINTNQTGFVPAAQYLAVRTGDDKMIGMVNIRHELNDYLFEFGGHIGYSVRKSERRKGYAKEMLRLALEKCVQLGLDRVLITCDKDNTASAKTILANGGIFENEVVNAGRVMQRYWIDCPAKSKTNDTATGTQNKEYIEIHQMLHGFSDEDYAAFSRKLTPGCKNILGVRLPLLHGIASRICKKDWRAYLEHGLTGDTFEENMLRGFIIAACECGWPEKACMIQRFVAKIDNWSVCDSFCAALKTTRNNRDEMLAMVRKFILSESEFEVRFAAVILMTNYLDDDYFETALRLLSCARHEGYYAIMGVAWALSAAFFIRPQEVSRLLRDNGLDTRTAAKTREKIRQSKHYQPAVHGSLM